MRFDPYQLIWDKDQKAKEVFFIIDGIIHNEENDRVLNSGMMFGQDEILFKRDRRFKMRAEVETYTMRLSNEDFENMIEEYPDLKKSLLQDATFRDKINKSRAQLLGSKGKQNVEMIVKKFTELMQEIGFNSQV